MSTPLTLRSFNFFERCNSSITQTTVSGIKRKHGDFVYFTKKMMVDRYQRDRTNR